MKVTVQLCDINLSWFYYSIHNNPLAELVIYKESIDQPSVICGLNVHEGDTSVHFEKDKNRTFSHPSLLMALCWYMFLPVAKEKTADFAA